MAQTKAQQGGQYDLPAQVIIYDEGLGSCRDIAEMIGAARETLLSSSETADNNALLAKAYRGNRNLYLYVDRDNFEFVTKSSHGARRVTGGNLANEMRGVSVQTLRQMMCGYVEKGIPIHLPDKTRPKKATYRAPRKPAKPTASA